MSETKTERLARLIAGFDDALNRVSMYGPADRVRDNWDRLKAALAADPGQGEPPQLSKDEQILLDEYRQNKCGDHRCESLRQTAARIVLRGTDTHAWAAQLVHDAVKAECDRGIQLLTTDVAAPARTVQAEQPKSCEECQHVFSAADLAAEDRDAWGHPCFGTRFLRANCESHRGTVQAEPAPQAADKFDVLERLHAILTRYGIASRTMNHVLVTDLVTWAADSARQSASLGRETRVPHPPEPACTNCGELAKPSHYVDFVGPFCEGCWTHLKEYFAAARQETPAVPPASALVQTARKLAGEFIAHVTQKAVRYPGAPIILTMKEAQHLAAAFSLVLPSSVSAPERTK